VLRRFWQPSRARSWTDPGSTDQSACVPPPIRRWCLVSLDDPRADRSQLRPARRSQCQRSDANPGMPPGTGIRGLTTTSEPSSIATNFGPAGPITDRQRRLVQSQGDFSTTLVRIQTLAFGLRAVLSITGMESAGDPGLLACVYSKPDRPIAMAWAPATPTFFLRVGTHRTTATGITHGDGEADQQHGDRFYHNGALAGRPARLAASARCENTPAIGTRTAASPLSAGSRRPRRARDLQRVDTAEVAGIL